MLEKHPFYLILQVTFASGYDAQLIFKRVGVNFLKYSILYFRIILKFGLDDLVRMDYPVKIIAWVNLKVNTESVTLDITTVVK